MEKKGRPKKKKKEDGAADRPAGWRDGSFPKRERGKKNWGCGEPGGGGVIFRPLFLFFLSSFWDEMK